MPTTVITPAAFQTACAECADAIAAESWALAAKWYARAEAIAAGMEVEAGGSDTRYRSRETLAGLQKAIDVAADAARKAANTSRLVTTRTRHSR